MNIYDFTVKNQEGQDVSLSDYKDKVLLVVNTATECGFTPQYEDLQNLYDEFHKDGFDVLDFPCDQFGNQAPGSDEEIHTFCSSRFGVTFPQFSKIDVNGPDAIPLFKWLEEEAPFEGLGNSPAAIGLKAMLKAKDWNYKKSNDIKWNFTKFLVGRNGEVIARFEPTADMSKVKAAIEKALN